MRNLAALTLVTLDGVMQGPGDPNVDRSGGFKHGGWVPGYWNDFPGNPMSEEMKGPFGLLLGRKTYDLFAAYWPHAGEAPGEGIQQGKEVRRIQETEKARVGQFGTGFR